MFIEEKALTHPTVPVVNDWRPRPGPRRGRRTHTPSSTTRARWRAQARQKWPTYMPDVAYAIEGVPQPRRRHGRTFADLARAAFPEHITLGGPLWAFEAWRPEHRPPVVEPGELLTGYRQRSSPACPRRSVMPSAPEQIPRETGVRRSAQQDT